MKSSLAAAALALCVLAWPGCTPRDLEVEVSAEGAARFLGGCSARGECRASDVVPSIASGVATRGQLSIVDAQGRIRQRSRCFSVGLAEDANDPAVLAATLNQALRAELLDGFGYEDLEDPADATLVLVFFQALGVGAAREGTASCDREHVVGCAGFGTGFGQSYDIVCAGCQLGKPATASGGCVGFLGARTGDCIVNRCADLY